MEMYPRSVCSLLLLSAIGCLAQEEGLNYVDKIIIGVTVTMGVVTILVGVAVILSYKKIIKIPSLPSRKKKVEPIEPVEMEAQSAQQEEVVLDPGKLPTDATPAATSQKEGDQSKPYWDSKGESGEKKDSKPGKSSEVAKGESGDKKDSKPGKSTEGAKDGKGDQKVTEL